MSESQESVNITMFMKNLGNQRTQVAFIHLKLYPTIKFLSIRKNILLFAFELTWDPQRPTHSICTYAIFETLFLTPK